MQVAIRARMSPGTLTDVAAKVGASLRGTKMFTFRDHGGRGYLGPEVSYGDLGAALLAGEAVKAQIVKIVPPASLIRLDPEIVVREDVSDTFMTVPEYAVQIDDQYRRIRKRSGF